MLDIKSAFDTVSHLTITSRLKQLNCPRLHMNYISNSYLNDITKYILGNGETDDIPIKRVVKQGDPLSSFIFTICLDKALEGLKPQTHGFIQNSCFLTHIAYADDLIIVANIQAKLQLALDHLVSNLEPQGLNFNAKKCITISQEFKQLN
ncbi:hypothetical protein GJ496_009778 [Pomphorhynchus laevis]|nr:hypothetical protein GJ496_009778 [Pomphorhynchus laevis]